MVFSVIALATRSFMLDRRGCLKASRQDVSVQIKPASVAQLDARPTGDQEVVGSTPAWSTAFFHGDLIMKYFLSLLLIQEGQLSVSGGRMCTILVNSLED